MINLNKTNRRAITYIAVLVAVLLAVTAVRSGYTHSPRPIKIKVKSDKSIFGLKNELECAPGAKRGAGWTKGLTPGGLCGSGQLVRDHADYVIEDGIGGELM